MGAWGFKTFENDSALDWLGNFLDDPSEELVLKAFSTEPGIVTPGFLGKLIGQKAKKIPKELDGEEVLAAAEIVATLTGKPSEANPEEFRNLPSISLSSETRAKAFSAVQTVVQSSYLKDAWEETDDFEDWKREVQNLADRLR